MAKQIRKESRLNQCLKAPFRAVIKARDFYVNGMMNCAGRFEASAGAGAATGGHVYSLPKSFSTSSSAMNGDDQYIRDLMRAASTKSLRDKLELEILWSQVSRRQTVGPAGDVVPRSQSAAIGRIDEEGPCEFGDDDDVKVNNNFVPRSRSHALPKRASLV